MYVYMICAYIYIYIYIYIYTHTRSCRFYHVATSGCRPPICNHVRWNISKVCAPPNLPYKTTSKLYLTSQSAWSRLNFSKVCAPLKYCIKRLWVLIFEEFYQSWWSRAEHFPHTSRLLWNLHFLRSLHCTRPWSRAVQISQKSARHYGYYIKRL